ncbi:MAG: TonB-dependent receptor [Proteobacteria bacterium]|nr:TonB-dependent receptor [Pseudomonadota bacterium]
MNFSRFQALPTVAGMVLLTTPAFAGDLEGRIIAIGGNPQAGAIVSLEDTELTTLSDARGHFHFEDLAPGEYTLQIESNGDRESRRVVIDERDLVTLNIVMAAQLERVEVSSSAFGRSTLELSQPVEIISGEDLAILSQASIGETLSSQLGVTSTYFGPASGRPVIRGMTGNRVRVQQDGIGSMDVSALSPDHAVAIEPLLIDSVEIVKGPATLLYGNGAFGGVINMTDSRIPETSPYTPYSGAIEARGGTAADERSFVARLDGGGERFAWHVDAFTRRTDEVEIPGTAESEILHEAEGHEEEGEEEIPGILENSDVETNGGAIGGSWIGENGFFGLAVSRYDSNYGVPGHAHEEEAAAEEEHAEEGVRIDLGQTRYDVKGRRDNPFTGIETVKFRAGYNDYLHDEIEEGAISTRFENNEFDARLEMIHAPLAEWRGAFGVQVHDRDFSAVGEEAYVPPTESQGVGLFLVEEREVDAWRVELGGRIENQQQDATGFASQSDNAFSASGGLVRKLGEVQSLGINLTRAQRMPDIEERYSSGPHLATLQYEIGDPDLDTETANNLDLTWRKAGDGLNWTVNLFYNRVNDFIYLQNTGAEIEELPVSVYTQADAVLKGYEAEIVFPLLHAEGNELDLRLFSDYTRGTLVDGGNLPRIPPLRFGLGFDYTGPKWTAGIQAIRYDEQDELADMELPTEGYTMLDASIGYRVFTPHVDWNIFLRASNLLDEEARRHTSFLKDLAPLPGRNFTLGIRAGF